MITLYTFGPMFGLADPSPFVTKAIVQLKMSGLPFTADSKNALRKAPKGKLPFINDDGEIVADSTFILWHLQKKHGIDLDKGLSAAERATGWAFEKMCEDHLYWTILDGRWSVDSNFDRGPRRFFDAVPAPLRGLIISKIRRDVKRTLWGQGIGRHIRADIESLAKRDLDAISNFLGEKPFLFGDTPHAADATLYGFIAGALCPLFTTPIKDHAQTKPNLVAYVQRGNARWFPDSAL